MGSPAVAIAFQSHHHAFGMRPVAYGRQEPWCSTTHGVFSIHRLKAAAMWKKAFVAGPDTRFIAGEDKEEQVQARLQKQLQEQLQQQIGIRAQMSLITYSG